MSYTATLIDQYIDSGQINATVKYSNGSGKATTDSFSVSSYEDLKNQVRPKVAALNLVLSDPLPLGLIDLAAPIPTPPPAPTADQLAQQTYQQKRMDLIQAKQDLGLGIIDQPTYDAKLAEVKALI
jgi:hypothetical protein